MQFYLYNTYYIITKQSSAMFEKGDQLSQNMFELSQNKAIMYLNIFEMRLTTEYCLSIL